MRVSHVRVGFLLAEAKDEATKAKLNQIADEFDAHFKLYQEAKNKYSKKARNIKMVRRRTATALGAARSRRCGDGHRAPCSLQRVLGTGRPGQGRRRPQEGRRRRQLPEQGEGRPGHAVRPVARRHARGLLRPRAR